MVQIYGHRRRVRVVVGDNRGYDALGTSFEANCCVYIDN